MQLIDGKKIASEIKAEIALEVKEMLAQGHKAPHLAAVLVVTMAEVRPMWQAR